METRKMTRQSALKVKAFTKTLSTRQNKRKMSSTTSHEKPSKRSALGDISNKETVTLHNKNKQRKHSSVPAKSTCLSQENKTLSQESVDSQKAKNSEPCITKSVAVTIERLPPIETRTEPDGDEAECCRSSSQDASTLLLAQATVETLNWNDIDKENINDVFASPEYASDIFDYYRMMEEQFLVDDYMQRQCDILPSMRAVLVDWMVEVQENFELNHETLYMAVRLVDLYLMKKLVQKERLQLIGAAALFIGCKFDERIPPLVDDFLYICDDAYDRKEFVHAEKDILRTLNFNIGMPLSYRFLRRIAKASKKSMKTLTLARYIGEHALTSYKIVRYRESLIAAGCLKLAMMWIEPLSAWDDTLIHYSGYREHDLMEICQLLNEVIHTKSSTLLTIDSKYSHPVFHEVAKLDKLPVILFPDNRCSSTCIKCASMNSVYI